MDTDKFITATFSLLTTNQAPTAHAGVDQEVYVGETVTLDGSGSTDPDVGDSLTYGWGQTGGAPVMLSDPGAVRPTFVAPTQTGHLTFTLTVSDTGGLWDRDTVVVKVWYRIFMPLVLRE
jgi:hypothetical protein